VIDVSEKGRRKRPFCHGEGKVRVSKRREVFKATGKDQIPLKLSGKRILGVPRDELLPRKRS